MLKLLETLKDSAESTFDSAAARVENVHQLIGRYVGGQAKRVRGLSAGSDDTKADDQPTDPDVTETKDEQADPNIYDVLRGVNREVGEFGTDLFEIVDDARERRRVERDESDSDSQ